MVDSQGMKTGLKEGMCLRFRGNGAARKSAGEKRVGGYTF